MLATYAQASHLRQADNYLVWAINAEAKGNRKIVELALNRACLYELVGLGFCSLMRAKPKEKVNPAFKDYIDFKGRSHRFVSVMKH